MSIEVSVEVCYSDVRLMAGRGATGICNGLVLSALRGEFAFLVRFLFGGPCFFFCCELCYGSCSVFVIVCG